MSSISNLTPWGYHAIVDYTQCNTTAIQSESTIRAWLTELAPVVGNNALGEAYMAITGEGDSDKQGFTAVQLLDAGTITAHFVNSTKHLYSDVFSCKEFTLQAVEDITKKYFGNDITINKILLPRNAAARAPE